MITGGGVTAGIDFALTLVAELAGAEVAQAIQLSIEYAPAPPYAAWRPEDAPRAVLSAVCQRIAQIYPERSGAFQELLGAPPRAALRSPGRLAGRWRGRSS